MYSTFTCVTSSQPIFLTILWGIITRKPPLDLVTLTPFFFMCYNYQSGVFTSRTFMNYPDFSNFRAGGGKASGRGLGSPTGVHYLCTVIYRNYIYKGEGHKRRSLRSLSKVFSGGYGILDEFKQRPQGNKESLRFTVSILAIILSNLNPDSSVKGIRHNTSATARIKAKNTARERGWISGFSGTVWSSYELGKKCNIIRQKM